MAAYYKVEVSLNTNSVTVGSPSAQEVLVTLPLIGPTGATGATGATGPSGASTWDEIAGKPALFPPSAHDHQPGAVYADAAFVTQSGGSTLRSGIYLRNGTDNSRPVYESPTTGDYIWWDSDLVQWYLTSNTDVNLFYLEESADDFPWETDALWSPLSPQTGNIEVDQATMFDVSDYGSTSVVGLKTPKSGNASATELVLGSDSRLTNSRTPSSTLAHASSHHTGGTDALTPASIGAAAAQVLSGQFISGNTLLSAGRNRRITLGAINQTINVDLPYEGNENGDTVTLIAASGLFSGSTLSIRTATGMSGGVPVTYFTLATLTAAGQSFTFVSDGTATGWSLRAVDTHTHPASAISDSTAAGRALLTGADAAAQRTSLGLGTIATEALDALPETLRIVGGTDPTKKVAFEVDTLVSSATTRTLTVPNSSGTIALLETLPAGGTKTYATFTATDNNPPATAFATIDQRNSTAVLDFDDATDESAVFVSIIPEAASLGSGLKIRLHWIATSATSGNVVWDVSLERMNTDLDADSFSTIASGTAAANGTSGILTVTEITLTTIDSVTAGDGFRLKVTRDANNASDTMTGDAELVVCEVRSAA